MSKALTPNYCSCTVNQARNLPADKGKNGGIDPFCVISMGKEKFQTAVREKTTAPDWHEQCDMPIVDDATIKLTVYHSNKHALSKGDFIGRAYVSLRDLQDYDRVHTNWHKLTNKDGKLDKNRGEIEVSLQFYSKNNTTGSVMDLATKKKHLSFKDIKHSLSDRIKDATKHIKHDRHGSENQSIDQRSGLGDFHNDSASETTSFAGSHMSLNSMSYNNNNAEQQKKKTRAPNSGLGSTMAIETPHSSRRSVTSDYETSSILDSASMYGADESSTSSAIQTQIPQREVHVTEDLSLKKTSDKKKTKNPAPKIITTKLSNSSTDNKNQNSSVTGDDIDAAFDSINDYKKSGNKTKEPEIPLTPDSLFGLSSIKENLDTDETIVSSKQQNDDEIDSYFNKIKQTGEEKKPKKTAPIIPQSKSTKEQKRSTPSQADNIQTPATSISVKVDTTPTSPTILPKKEQSAETNDSTDEDVDELLGKLERMSSMRSSVRRKVQPKDDITQQTFDETDNKLPSAYQQTPPNRKNNTTLPDIVGGPNSSQRSTPSAPKKLPNNSLNVLGYENVKNTPVNPKIRQELDYLDREELLHVIAYQSDLIKKRDTRVKDLENYADGLLVKIVEQCPSILQNGGIKFNHK